MANRLPNDYAIDESVVNGTELARILERTEAARNSTESGTSRPAYLKKGGLWTKLESGGDVTVMVYDGTTDIPLVNSLIGGTSVTQYSSAATYKANDLVTYNGDIWEAKGAIAPGPWAAGQWTQRTGTPSIVPTPAAGTSQSITAGAKGDTILKLTSAAGQTANKFQVDTAGLVLTSQDRLGVGTATPGAQLDVNGTARVKSQVDFGDGSTQGGAIKGHASGVGLDINQPNGTVIATFDVNGMKLNALKGTGSRMVVADANGVLGTAAVPSYNWGNLTGKPATFPPTIGTSSTTAAAGNHNHAWASITGKPAVVEHSGNLVANHMVTAVNSDTVKDSTVVLNTASKVMQFPTGWKLGIGAAPSEALHVVGKIQATQDITAFFSDSRLKRPVGYLSEPLAKVGKLRAFTYRPNSLALELGAAVDDEVRVGLSAQEVQSVLPEAVSPAPFDTDEKGKSRSGDNYLTVDYSKLVPLLVDAINALTRRVEELEHDVT